MAARWSTVDTGGRRNMDGIDPNRNFSADGVGCSKLGTDAAPQYTAFFRELIDRASRSSRSTTIPTSDIPTGGLGHASMASVPKDMEVVPAADPNGPLAGDRNLVLLTSPIPVSDDGGEPRRGACRQGHQRDDRARRRQGDCSLSNYALLTGHPDYLNVTVDHDERDKQRKIIDVIMAGRNDDGRDAVADAAVGMRDGR